MSNELLQQALEALQDLLLEFRGHDLPYGSKAYSKGIDISYKIKAALVQPEQEIVAWQWLDTAHFRKKIPHDSKSEQWRPLYTSRREWDSLTGAERINLWRQGHSHDSIGAVNDYLKEKNK